ncbi:hypothetical protein DBV15_06532 [Temnothorax longispinosus]|uniref:Gustatory receptor n=1 Tax=Temnothorax longispinosus TaxID=300112 RepID=A0A4S2KA98_9HYME|nr:hypothetical protein DBV15_06532 [Temnothorax longispinosus]
MILPTMSKSIFYRYSTNNVTCNVISLLGYRFAMCLKKLAAVDDTLEELGTPKMYRKIYIWSKRVVIVWIMYSMTANKNDKVIHQLTSVRQYANISEEIHQFTLQTMQHPLKFSGMGLFYFGNAFLRKVEKTNALTHKLTNLIRFTEIRRELTHRIARVSVIMIDTVEKALSPIFLAASFLGFGILRYPLNQPRYRLSIFYILTVWSVYAYVLYYTMTYLFLEGVYTEFITFGMTVNLLAAITSIIITNCKHIGDRLDKINNHIKQLSETEDCGLRCKWKKFLVVKGYNVRNAKNRKHILWIVIHLHLELCRTARDINGFFGVQMTLQIISYFILLNEGSYFEYHTILHLKEIINNNAHKTKSIIHKLTNLICFAEAREEIYQFVLQVSLRPLKFSGLGLFYFGYAFIRKLDTLIEQCLQAKTNLIISINSVKKQ